MLGWSIFSNISVSTTPFLASLLESAIIKGTEYTLAIACSPSSSSTSKACASPPSPKDLITLYFYQNNFQ